MSAITNRYPELLYVMPAAGASYNNSSSRTLLSAATACRIPVELVLPGQAVGKVFGVRCQGFYGTTGTPTLIVAAALDTTAGSFGTALAATGAYTTESSAGAGTIGFELEFDLTVHTEGSSGTVNAAGTYTHGTSGNASTTAGAAIMVGSTTDITLNTTQDNFIEVWGTWSAPSASNALTLTQFKVWCWN